jgi:hypothetical protein
LGIGISTAVLPHTTSIVHIRAAMTSQLLHPRHLHRRRHLHRHQPHALTMHRQGSSRRRSRAGGICRTLFGCSSPVVPSLNVLSCASQRRRPALGSQYGSPAMRVTAVSSQSWWRSTGILVASPTPGQPACNEAHARRSFHTSTQGRSFPCTEHNQAQQDGATRPSGASRTDAIACKLHDPLAMLVTRAQELVLC